MLEDARKIIIWYPKMLEHRDYARASLLCSNVNLIPKDAGIVKLDAGSPHRSLDYKLFQFQSNYGNYGTCDILINIYSIINLKERILNHFIY